MKKQIQQLIEWHEKFEMPYKTKPDPFNDSSKEQNLIGLRSRIMKEEIQEWTASALCKDDVDKRAKELADILYTVLGTVITEGLQDVIEQVFDEVHKSNMSKLGANGKPIKRPDGKVLKGPNYKEPDLSFVIQHYQ